MNMNFCVPVRTITGKGCVMKNQSVFSALGGKCLIVTGKTSAIKSGALDDVENALDATDTGYRIFDGIEQNPTYKSCEEAAAQAKEIGAQFIVGIGGGSPLDAAKAVAVLAANDIKSSNEFYSGKWENAPLPVIAVGTTAGTGSEVTPVAVITAPDGMKKSIKDVSIVPAVCLGDPSYTMSLSPYFTRSTALDALSHCVESYFNKEANDMSRTFALRGTQILLQMLPKTAACEHTPLSWDDREKLYCASLYAGYAISVTGTAFPHAMGYFLSEEYAVPHGNACAVYLEDFLHHNENVAPDDVKEFFYSLRTDMETLISLIRENLPDLGVVLAGDDVERLSPRYENNKSLKKCFGTVDKHFATALLRKLFVK